MKRGTSGARSDRYELYHRRGAGDASGHPRGRALERPQLRAAAGGPVEGRGLLRVGRGRQALPRHAERLLRAQPGAPPSRHPGSAARAGRPHHPDLAGLPQRPHGPLPPRAVRGHRLREGTAHEHGGRGRGDGAQGRPEVGLHSEGSPRGPGRDYRVREQLPRTHDDDRGLLDRGPVPARLRTVHARLQDHRVRRCHRPRGRDHREHGRVPRGADPGRGRCHRAARRLPGPLRRDLRRARPPPHQRRDPDGPRAHRTAVLWRLGRDAG